MNASQQIKSDILRGWKSQYYYFVIMAFLLVCDRYSRADTTDVIIETQAHAMGSGAGGSFFQRAFIMQALPGPFNLEFDISGPNYESPPYVKINGVSGGSIRPFFPGFNQTNSDGSHDYNGLFHVVLPFGNILIQGINTFQWFSGRPDDHYTFSNVKITLLTVT